MGKTYRNVFAGSNSTDYHSPQNRGFAKFKKQHSHRKVRKHNKCCDDENIISLKNLNCNQIMKNHWASGYYGKRGNIANDTSFQFNDNCLYKDYGIQWNNYEKSPLEMVNRIIEEGNKDPKFKMCKKQIERRGTMGLFYGYR